jgi:hypothetical protein
MEKEFKYSDLWKDRRLPFVILGSCFFFIPSPICVAIGSAWLFAMYDVIGFEYTDCRRNSPAYRTIQVMFMIFVLFAAFLYQGINATIAGLFMWWCFVPDLIFHWALKYDIKNVTWFKGCAPMLFSKYILKKDFASFWIIMIFYFLGVLLGSYIASLERFF